LTSPLMLGVSLAHSDIGDAPFESGSQLWLITGIVTQKNSTIDKIYVDSVARGVSR